VLVDSIESRRLTPREKQLVTSLTEGLTNKAIAARHGVSEHTVKVQLGKLYAKIGVKGRLALVLWALKR
jgi:DNA-binding CsgD family transcriptional regulator